VIWSEHLPTFLMQMFGKPVVAGDAQANSAPELLSPLWVPAHENEEPPF